MRSSTRAIAQPPNAELADRDEAEAERGGLRHGGGHVLAHLAEGLDLAFFEVALGEDFAVYLRENLLDDLLGGDGRQRDQADKERRSGTCVESVCHC